MVSLHFIGTIHSDPHGISHLRRALELESPDILSTECSQNVLVYLQSSEYKNLRFNILKKMKRHGASPFLLNITRKKFFTFDNFEIFVPQEYASCKGIPLYFVDDPMQVEYIRKSFEEQYNDINKRSVKYRNAFFPQNFRNYDPYIEIRKLFFRGILQEEEQLVYESLGHLKGLSGRREEILAENLRKVCLVKEEEKIVHVCGVGHLFRDPKHKETLFSKLEEFHPTRKLLCDY
ncbi:MAG: hypothetical protein Q8R18_05595 [bacterium]|nr:hypothetical protein [bacterium]